MLTYNTVTWREEKIYIHHCINNEKKSLNPEEEGTMIELLKELLFMIISEAQWAGQCFNRRHGRVQPRTAKKYLSTKIIIPEVQLSVGLFNKSTEEVQHKRGLTGEGDLKTVSRNVLHQVEEQQKEFSGAENKHNSCPSLPHLSLSIP